MGAGIRKKAAINGIIEEQGRTILDGEVVDDESFVLVIVEQVRDPKLPELGVGEQANDVADVVAPESPGISETNRLKRSEEAAGCTGIPKDLRISVSPAFKSHCLLGTHVLEDLMSNVAISLTGWSRNGTKGLK